MAYLSVEYYEIVKNDRSRNSMHADTLEHFPTYCVLRKGRYRTICIECFHFCNPPKTCICIYMFICIVPLFKTI